MFGEFLQILDNLSKFRAGQVITGVDLFRIFVVIHICDIDKYIEMIIKWEQRVNCILKFEVHPVSVLLLTRVYFICAQHYNFAYSETTKILKIQNKVHFLFFFWHCVVML